MTTVSDLQVFLESIAPQSRKMDWDNVGLHCGSSSKEVKRVLIALDPFEAVIREAAEKNCDLIITHHPLIFQPISSVTDKSSVGRCIQLLIQHDIASFHLHTNLDIAPNGVNQVLAETLGLQDIQIVEPIDTDEAGQEWGLLRRGQIDPLPLDSFLRLVKEKLGTPVLRHCQGSPLVHRVAVGGGACAGELESVIRAGCDTFVTSDAKYNQFWDAYDAGINLIDAGHFYTENPICAPLGQMLQTAFPGLDILISQTHSDCMKFF